ncbi:hypothetical protein [Priestia filamentosa]|nr:hypothetical protein [Priestia filamentosa]
MKAWIEELFENDLSFKEVLVYTVFGGLIVFGMFYGAALLNFLH